MFKFKTMTIDGIIIRKTVQKEKDLIVTILTSAGQKISLYCYSGSGGGKKQTGSLLQLGYYIEFELKNTKGKNTLTSSEWRVKWYYKVPSLGYEVFNELCSYLQAMDVLLPEEHDLGEGQQGLFSLLSNILYSIETSPNADYKRVGLYLVKFIYYQGLEINTHHCAQTHQPLKQGHTYFSPVHGGFISQEVSYQDDFELLLFIQKAYETFVKDFLSLPCLSQMQLRKLIDYLSYHSEKDLKKTLMYLL